MNPWQDLSAPTTRDADAEHLVALMRQSGGPSLRERGAEGARRYLEERAAGSPAGPELDFVRDASTAGPRAVPVRVYRARPASGLPVVVYFHGGGWVIGSIAASDAFCRRLAHAADCVVVSVGYPLAPENPFPAAPDSAADAIAWAAARASEWGGDPDRLLVLGDSAGGNVAAVAVRRLVGAHQAPRVRRQILAYPVTAGQRPAAGGHFGHEWPLTDDDLAWFTEQYAPDPAIREDPNMAPLLADAAGMPPTTLLLGGCDPLLPEGLAYADRLWRAGVSVDLHVYSGQIHGFLTMDERVLPRSAEALGVVATVIRHS